MEGDAMSFVEFANKTANLRSHHPFKWLPVGRDHVYSNPAGTQGCCDFQADKAGADDDSTFCGRRLGDDRLAVSEGAKIVNLRIRRTFDAQVNRVGAGCEQQSVIFERSAILENNLPALGVNGRSPGIEQEVNPSLAVVFRRTQ